METIIGLDVLFLSKIILLVHCGFLTQGVLSLFFISLSTLDILCSALQMTGRLLGSYFIDHTGSGAVGAISKIDLM